MSALKSLRSNWDGTVTIGSVNLLGFIDGYSTEEEASHLLNGLMTDGSRGFHKVLSELKTRGRVVIPGRTGYEAKFIRQSPTKSGREIRIVLDRRMSFLEVYYDEPSKDYDVSALEINLHY